MRLLLLLFLMSCTGKTENYIFNKKNNEDCNKCLSINKISNMLFIKEKLELCTDKSIIYHIRRIDKKKKYNLLHLEKGAYSHKNCQSDKIIMKVKKNGIEIFNKKYSN